MKKIYVKPEMAIENIELESMIAASLLGDAEANSTALGKDRGFEEDMESSSSWGDLW